MGISDANNSLHVESQAKFYTVLYGKAQEVALTVSSSVAASTKQSASTIKSSAKDVASFLRDAFHEVPSMNAASARVTLDEYSHNLDVWIRRSAVIDQHHQTGSFSAPTNLRSMYAWLVLHVYVNQTATALCAELLALCVCIYFARRMYVGRRRKKTSPFRGSMERSSLICRAPRNPGSSFDFFGLNHSNSASYIPGGGAQRRGRAARRDSLQSVSSVASRRDRMGSMDSMNGFARQRADSMDFIRNESEHVSLNNGHPFSDGQTLFDEFGPIAYLSSDMHYYGPSIHALEYHAATPPSTWNEASRRILPQEHMLQLQRDLRLDLSKQLLSVVEDNQTAKSKWDFSLPVAEFSIHVVPPNAGGVINLYVKGSSKEEWMEFTFDTAQMAAQFQIDLLANQVFGRVLYSIYHTLCLVHQGSEAYRGQEFAIHDNDVVVEEQTATKENEEQEKPATTTANVSPHGLAWDDAMRAMSTIPSVRIALERLWLSHHGPRRPRNTATGKRQVATVVVDSAKAAPVTAEQSMSENYQGKRFLLGPVDFFRLFVPSLPETAVPESESDKARMEQLLRWRKRIARAAVLVNAYRKARCIANKGWNLPLSADDGNVPLKKRLAYDDNAENNKHDLHAENEYYEATVSRDVLCNVRPYDYFRSEDEETEFYSANRMRSTSVLSPYQAYTLVGTHCFALRGVDSQDALMSHRDPVKAIPSLRHLIASHPDVHFFVTNFYSEARGYTMIAVYARSLPEGVDAKFDNVINRYCAGDKALRDRKLHFMFQLGPTIKESFVSWLVIRILLFLFSLTRKGRESNVTLQPTKDRTPFPALRMVNYCQTHHFGGSLQTDASLPKNYVAITSVYGLRHMPNFISQLLFGRLEMGTFENNIVDFTWLLEGEQEDELPERALCTLRSVHVQLMNVRHPVSSDIVPVLENDSKLEADEQRARTLLGRTLNDVVSRMGQVRNMGNRTDGVNNEASLSQNGDESAVSFKDALRHVESDDPLEKAANQITDLLEDIHVTKNISSMNNANSKRRKSEDPTIAVLETVSRDDMKRYFIAADYSLKTAAMRIIDTAAWRETMFPIDTRRCRIELQNGQFFQQGRDKQGNLVFYFRNMCLGPWREDPEASVLAVLSRLDRAISDLRESEPRIRCTLIVLMGKPYRFITEVGGEKNVSGHTGIESGASIGDEETTVDGAQDVMAGTANSMGHKMRNPRIHEGENWFSHTNKAVLTKLFDVLTKHYPERLANVYVVPGRGRNPYFDVNLGGKTKMLSYVPPVTVGKVHFLKRDPSKLTLVVSPGQLLKLVGGEAEMNPQVFASDR